jgi:FMN-binding domain
VLHERDDHEPSSVGKRTNLQRFLPDRPEPTDCGHVGGQRRQPSGRPWRTWLRPVSATHNDLLRAGQVVYVTTVEAPQGGRSGEIASDALPQLRKEVLAAQSARIDGVSGASYDSQAYADSVQSALDRLPG